MPHDKHGQVLSVGDEVIVRCKVLSISLNPDYCNVVVETLEKMYPGDRTSISLNSAQVEIISPGLPQTKFAHPLVAQEQELVPGPEPQEDKT